MLYEPVRIQPGDLTHLYERVTPPHAMITSFQLTVKMRDQLKRAAKAEQCAMADIVRRAIRTYLDTHHPESGDT